MAQLGRFDESFNDTATGLPHASVSVTIYREGATFQSGSGTSPATLTVRNNGKIEAGDTVFINTVTGTTYSVDSVTDTTVVVSGFAGTLAPSAGDRIIASNSLPTLYSDDQGGASEANPLTTDSNGRAETALEAGTYDYIVSDASITSVLFSGHIVTTGTPSQIRQAASFPGDDWGEQVGAAIADLPSTGGIVDARGLTGTQSIAATLTISQNNLTLLVGQMTLTLNAGISISSTDSVRILGLGGTTSMIVRGGGYTGDLIAFSATIGDVEIAGLNIDNQASAKDCITFADGATDIEIHHLRFPAQGAGDGVEFATTATLRKRISIHAIYAEAASATANADFLDIGDSGDDTRIYDCTLIKTGKVKVDILDTATMTRVRVHDCSFQGVDGTNILIRPKPNSTQIRADVVVRDNIFEDAGLTNGKGFIGLGENFTSGSVPFLTRAIVTGNIGRGWSDDSNNGVGIGISGSTGDSDTSEIVITNNVLDGRKADGTVLDTAYGLWLRNRTRNCIVANNVIRNTGRAGIISTGDATIKNEFIDIHDNVLELNVQTTGATGPAPAGTGAIMIDNDTENVRIHHNRILNPGQTGGASYGIYIDDDSDINHIVMDNNDIIDDRAGSATMILGILFASNLKNADATSIYSHHNRVVGGVSADNVMVVSVDATTINPFADFVYLDPDQTRTLTATPTIPDGYNGQEVTLVNVSTTGENRNIVLQDQSSLASSNMIFDGAADITLVPNDMVTLRFHEFLGDWLEVSRSSV